MLPTKQQQATTLWRHWRGLGGWNYYFLLKFVLLWYGYLNFHPFLNLVFLAFLLCPVPSLFLHRCRNWLAIPIGLALFYHDTWLPNIYSLVTQGTHVLQFSPAYILELFNRFINWQMLGAAFILLVAYLFVAQWIRLTVLTVIALSWLNVLELYPPGDRVTSIASKPIASPPAVSTAVKPATNQFNRRLPPTNANLSAHLNNFYAQEKTRQVDFPSALAADAQPFDILIIQICSLSWADLDTTHLRNHPLWGQFDILFNEFNSAASYSGPAMLRLMRANCGQTPHAALYAPAPAECQLMNNLAKLGFSTEIMLDHNGVFGGFLQELHQDADLANTPLISPAGIKQSMLAFDDSPIYNDAELLNRWLQQKQQIAGGRSATYYNSIALHDGNRSTNDGKFIPYAFQARKFLDQLAGFLTHLEQSGRKVLVIVVPDHGANLTGDKLQMPGLRDIPSPALTHVPVGIKLIGMKAAKPKSTLQIDNPSSYLAIAELVKRLLDGKLFNQSQVDWQALTDKLPQTASVAENEGIKVIEYQGKFYIQLKDDPSWIPYPF